MAHFFTFSCHEKRAFMIIFLFHGDKLEIRMRAILPKFLDYFQKKRMSSLTEFILLSWK